LGASHFVTTANLINKHMPGLGTINTRTIRRAERILKDEKGKDRYEEFYSLLYDEDQRWSAELQKVLFKESICQKFNKGQGYMINDRVWMHGRGATKGLVNGKRLHRLVFNNKETSDCH
jgi:hypothetical protein